MTDLRGSVVTREWMKGIGPPPKEWERGLWGLDAGVLNAIRGGWTDEEIAEEIQQLIESYRAALDEKGKSNG